MDVDIGLALSLPASDHARIVELARGLDYNWWKCYLFVRDHIAYAPYHGILRGPERTLLDREGNDADQALLLYALLQASGYRPTLLYQPFTPTSGFLVPLTDFDGGHPYNAVNWLNLDGSDNVVDILGAARRRLYAGGHEVGYDFLGAAVYLATDHFWISVNTGTATWHLDPSLKPSSAIVPGDPLQDANYTRDGFLNAIGGTTTTTSVQGIDTQILNTALNGYSASLRACWTNANASASFYIGAAEVEPQTDDAYFHGYVRSQNSWVDFLSLSADYQNSFRASATLSHGSLSQQFYLDELGDRSLWLSYETDSASAYPKAVLHLGDSILAAETSGASSAAASMPFSVSFASGSSQNTYALSRSTSNVYAIPVGFGGDARNGMRAWASSELARIRAEGLADTSPRLLAQSLVVAGQQYLSQVAMLERFRNHLTGSDRRDFYNIGVAGQDGAPYVDMRDRFGYATSDATVFHGDMLFASALEHAVLDQLNGIDSPSVSTVKLLSLANAANLPVYYATTANYASVAPLLTGYSASQTDSFQTAVSAGRTLLLPQSGALTLNAWTGCGYIEHGPASAGSSMYITGMIIGGRRNGGYCSVNCVPSSVSYGERTIPSSSANGAIAQTTQADPVAMPSGAFLDEATDLVVPAGTPLVWPRTYDSRCSATDGPLGRGWTHSFAPRIVETSDPDAAFGSGSVAAAIPSALAVAVVEDLLSDEPNLSAGEIARRRLAAALVVQWWADRITASTATVQLGAQALSFQRLDDGTYAPFPGVTAELSRTPLGGYILAERLEATYEFDVDGRLTSITDRSGNATTLTYDADGHQTHIENAFGARLDLSWTGGRIASVSDSAARTVRYAYNADGCLVSVTDPAGKVRTQTYDPESFALLSKVDPEGRTLVENTYNSLGQVVGQISANGEEWSFGYVADTEAWDDDPCGNRLEQHYDTEGRVLQRIDRDGAFTIYGYDGHGHVYGTLDVLGRYDFAYYDEHDRLWGMLEAAGGLGRTTLFGYDAADRLVSVTNALGLVESFAYDSCDRVVNHTYADGSYTTNEWTTTGLLAATGLFGADNAPARWTEYTYNARGLAVAATTTGPGLPAGLTETTTYTSAGFPAAQTDPLGRTTRYAWDACGRLLSTTNSLSGVTSRTYTDSGDLASATDALGHTTAFRWNASGTLAATIAPDGGVATNRYDAVDNLASATDARGTATAYLRDACGRPLRISTGCGTNTFVYTLVGLPAITTNASGVATSWHYDDLYRPVARTDGRGSVWACYRNLLGWPLASANPLQKIRWNDYDNGGRLVASERPSGATDAFVYDAQGSLLAVTNFEGHVTRQTFDAVGRLLSVTDAEGRRLVLHTYDACGNLATRTDAEGNILVHTYDALDRLIARTGPGLSETFAYDAVGNILSATSTDAAETFGYDSMDRLVSASVTLGNVPFALFWRHDHGGLVTNIVYAPGKTLTHAYDADGRLVAVTDWLGHEWTFSRDGGGLPLGGVSPDGREHVFSCDAAGDLSGWGVSGIAGRSIQRDAAGRRITDAVTLGTMPVPAQTRRATNVFDAADRLVSSQALYGDATVPIPETYLHDANGSLTNIVADSESVFEASYSSAGRLATLDGTGFTYDALGNCVSAGGTYWIPDFADPLKRPLLECDSDGTVLRYYLWGDGRLLGYIDADGVLTVAHSDDQGSVIALGTVSGDLLFTAHYGPYGEDWGSTGTNPTPFGWLGGYGVMRQAASVPAAPLYRTRHRLYSATLRRFLSADPAGLSGGLNLYAYAEGNPLAYIDPLGLCAGESKWGKLLTRIGGGFQMVGGIAESAAGATFAVGTAETGVGVVAGAAVFVHGADVTTAGAYKLWYGKPQDTLTSQAIQSLGVSQNTANLIDASASVVLTMGAGVANTAAQVPKVANPTVTVSRWGREGLQSGDFVMKGGVNRVNHILSGKWQPSWMIGDNTPAPFNSGIEYTVPKSSLSYPNGWEIIKAPLGQRIYTGPTIPPPQ